MTWLDWLRFAGSMATFFAAGMCLRWAFTLQRWHGTLMTLNRTLDLRQEALTVAEKAIDQRLDLLIERMDRLGIERPPGSRRVH